MKLNYISNVNIHEVSGGWSGLNKQLFSRLSLLLDLNYIGPFDLPIIKSEWYVSKLLRTLRLKGKYFSYSELRLSAFAKELELKINNSGECIFLGSTPWVKAKIPNNYYIITDICFMGYYKYYNKPEFSKKDIKRIVIQEKAFMQNAKYVFFTSEWAKRETCEFYNLNGDNFINIGIGGNTEGNCAFQKEGPLSFLYISQHFAKKGGDLLFDAFKQFYKIYSDSKLRIIGGAPQQEVINHPGVEYIGFINKSIPEENKRYMKLLSESSALVLPTKSDAAPLTIIECGYFGTPTIAPNRFAIPEMIINEKTGYLLKNNFTASDIYDYMNKLKVLSLEERNSFRKQTYQYFQEHNSWENIINKIYIKIKASNN